MITEVDQMSLDIAKIEINKTTRVYYLSILFKDPRGHLECFHFYPFWINFNDDGTTVAEGGKRTLELMSTEYTLFKGQSKSVMGWTNPFLCDIAPGSDGLMGIPFVQKEY